MYFERWNFFRIELRFTLKMKPDIEKSYFKCKRKECEEYSTLERSC